MSESEKDRLAALVIDQHCAFEQALALNCGAARIPMDAAGLEPTR